MTKHTTTEIVDATIQLFAELDEMMGLISRVLAKFPAETVPQYSGRSSARRESRSRGRP
ncbi:hypothetical protein SAZ11_08035 [Streptomyces sp. FXJ1.4098]|nr:hypothetical protein [Streptomyces sp. FXJ1.4098]